MVGEDIQRAGSLAAALALMACAAETPAPLAVVPLASVAEIAAMKQVRPCRSSHEHWLHGVRVVVNDLAVVPYTSWVPFAKDNAPFPVGSLVVKPEYDDPNCTEPVGATIMRKEAPGYWPAGHDWRWQQIDHAGRVVRDGRLDKACAACHVEHCKPPNGFDLTCTPD